MGKAQEGVGYGLVGIAYLIMGILGMIIHVWTIVIAFASSGLLGAVITLGMPVLSQIFWFIKVWSMAGTLLNIYCIAILAYVGLWIVCFVGVTIISSSSDRN